MTTKKYETVLIEKQDGITWLIMNRPDKRNAMSPQLHLDMDDALDELSGDPETQVLVLTGAGEAFCAGQDIKLYFRGGDADPKVRRKASRASNQWRWQRLSTFPVPTIAMINGYCFGGGFTQVCACDLAIAADDAVFGLSEVNWGILPGGIVSWNVAQTLNMRDGMYYALTGDTFDGKKAKEIGFVNFSYPKAALKAETVKLAKKLMEKSPAVSEIHQGSAARGALHERAAGVGLSQRQERRVAVCRQGRQPRPGHEAVPGRQELSARLRRLQAPEGEAGLESISLAPVRLAVILRCPRVTARLCCAHCDKKC